MCVGGGGTEVKCKAAFGWCATSASEIWIFVGGSNITQRFHPPCSGVSDELLCSCPDGPGCGAGHGEGQASAC